MPIVGTLECVFLPPLPVNLPGVMSSAGLESLFMVRVSCTTFRCGGCESVRKPPSSLAIRCRCWFGCRGKQLLRRLLLPRFAGQKIRYMDWPFSGCRVPPMDDFDDIWRYSQEGSDKRGRPWRTLGSRHMRSPRGGATHVFEFQLHSHAPMPWSDWRNGRRSIVAGLGWCAISQLRVPECWVRQCWLRVMRLRSVYDCRISGYQPLSIGRRSGGWRIPSSGSSSLCSHRSQLHG